jgi:hypothetical protein
LCLTLLYIRTNNAALLRPRLLRYSLWRRTVHWHLHALSPLVRVHLCSARRREVLGRRICVLVQRWRFRPRAVLSLCVWWVGCVGRVRVLRLVKGEVVLWDLAVAAAFRVGYEELLRRC